LLVGGDELHVGVYFGLDFIVNLVEEGSAHALTPWVVVVVVELADDARHLVQVFE
jgi:hypothetical protein